ncbi:MAG: FtsX-like permease family protein, partial [Bacteroidota bacterium]
TSVPANLGPLLKQDYPEIEAFVRFFPFHQGQHLPLEYQGETYPSEFIMATDSQMLSVFELEWVAGDRATALQGPDRIVLSRSEAKRIFGKEDPMGKVLTATVRHRIPDQPSEYRFQVSGIYEDLPPNVHLRLDGIISLETDPFLHEYYFNRFLSYTYLLLKEGVDPADVEPKLSEPYDNYLDPEREPVMKRAKHALVPIKQIHLTETDGWAYVWVFSAVGILMLMIAVISYINLITAQASRRALEIGIRKVMGGQRKQLIVQFLVESVLYGILAWGLSLVLVRVLVEPVNQLLHLQLYPTTLWEPRLVLSMSILVLLTGLAGGSYPAFFLSAFQPVQVMKGRLARKAPLRKLLVSVQFAVVLFVLGCAGVIHSQMEFLQAQELGFDQEVIRLDLDGPEWFNHYRALRDKLEQHPEITAIGSGDFMPGTNSMGRRPVSANGTAGQEARFVRFGAMDYDFAPALGLEVVAGRTFSRDHPIDLENGLLVNETFVREFGLEDPIGKPVRYGDKNNPNHMEIVGVLKDFHHSTLHSAIEPQVFTLSSAVHLVVKPSVPTKEALSVVEGAWAEILPNQPFAYRVLAEELQSGYESDQIRSHMFTAFSFFTLIICFLGLFGLASYLAGQRVRELSIHKIVGARFANLLMLLSKEFVWLVLLAALPAFILAWYVSQQWLETFSVHVGMELWRYLNVFFLILILTLAITSWQVIRVGQNDPAQALRQE